MGPPLRLVKAHVGQGIASSQKPGAVDHRDNVVGAKRLGFSSSTPGYTPGCGKCGSLELRTPM